MPAQGLRKVLQVYGGVGQSGGASLIIQLSCSTIGKVLYRLPMVQTLIERTVVLYPLFA